MAGACDVSRGLCPLSFGREDRMGCLGDRCAWFHRLMDDCVLVVAAVTLPPALGELNSHLADLVEIDKRVKAWAMGGVSE